MTESSSTSRSGPSDAELARAVPRDAGAREARVGLFVIVGILSFVVILFILTDPASLRGRYMLVTRVEDAGGVRKGDPVQMRGVNVGRVHDFEMTPTQEVDITLEIEKDWSIPRGSVTQLMGLGMFGGRTMAILPSLSTDVHAPGDTLPGTGGDQGPLEAVGAVGAQAEAVLTRVSEVLDEPTVASMRGTISELESLLREIRQLTASQQDNITQLTESLNRSAEGIESATTGPELQSAIAHADSTLTSLNETSATLAEASSSLRSILARIDAGEGMIGRLMQDDSLYDNLNGAVTSLHELLDDLKANPERYIRLSIF